MTRAAWAEDRMERVFERWLRGNQVDGWLIPFSKELLAEHRRAVRVVRRELEKFQRRRECETNASQRDMLGGAMLACSNILAALQKGRT